MKVEIEWTVTVKMELSPELGTNLDDGTLQMLADQCGIEGSPINYIEGFQHCRGEDLKILSKSVARTRLVRD